MIQAQWFGNAFTPKTHKHRLAELDMGPHTTAETTRTKTLAMEMSQPYPVLILDTHRLKITN